MSFIFPAVTRVAVTLWNFEEVSIEIASALANTPLIGFDIETEDSGRHQGLNDYMAGAGKKLVFDVNRTTVVGLSIWPDNHPTAWYINLNHADKHNCVPWIAVEALLKMKPPTSQWVIHNAAFERTMMAKSLNFDVVGYIDTMVMAVSAYSSDEYDIETFKARDLGSMANLVPEIVQTCRLMTETEDMKELMGKIIGKESDAAHSYNGWVKEMTYGYGLKQAVKSWFGYEMKTFEETLHGRDHMGQLTVEEVYEYGCDDAIWCVRLYHRLLKFMMDTNPDVISTFFLQELPMVDIYSDVWQEGVKINTPAVVAKRDDIRAEYAAATASLKLLIQKLLPFDAEPHKGLFEKEEWYEKNHQKYRDKIAAWATSPDNPDPFLQATQLSGAIPNAWAAERGVKLTGKQQAAQLNLTHYMPMRVLMYDLFRQPKLVLAKGKVQSDAWARGRLQERLIKHGELDAANVMLGIGKMATIEQVSKLYITPYLKLIDPDTDRMYPVLGSELASRRTSMRIPNAQQLSKRNPETTYVRGFYEADQPDHVIVSIDWSQIELVLIGEASNDPYFNLCYGQLPYQDLHEIACADCLEVDIDLEFRLLKEPADFLAMHGPNHKLLLNPRGEAMDPKSAYKYWRTEIGKGSNFSYWYSGALNQVGERLGWTSDEMFGVTEKYRNKFSVGEAWRMEQIMLGKEQGFIKLPDGHRRTRYEATLDWARHFKAKWMRYPQQEVSWFIDKVIRRLQSRANNQIVNSLIQGTCATIAKRSVPRINQKLREWGWPKEDARFMLLVHDELVYSVQRDRVCDFIPMASAIMNNHPEIVSRLVMDCSPSVGLTFEPWHKSKARTGQIELREAPPLDFIEKEMIGKEIPFDQWPKVVDWLFHERNK